ncbi:MAG TPA: hypothetical protein VEX62_08030 [Candidatus Limnocylindrales bacterium]|nr:hypothetical protein [Candidatus Limnocylindrales bacterium]
MIRALLAALLLAGCATGPIPLPTASPAGSPTAPNSTPTLIATPAGPTPAPTQSEPSPGVSSSPSAVFIDGTYRVPDDVPPGTYRTIDFATECYWTRLRGFESGLSDIIASRIGAGFQVVTIGERDAGFDSVGCGAWTDELVTVLESRTEFGEGTYIVGADIDPGVYASAEGLSCSWERLAGFGGTRRQRIERVFVADGDMARVNIEETDAGFSSSGCGSWRRVDD